VQDAAGRAPKSSELADGARQSAVLVLVCHALRLHMDMDMAIWSFISGVWIQQAPRVGVGCIGCLCGCVVVCYRAKCKHINIPGWTLCALYFVETSWSLVFFCKGHQKGKEIAVRVAKMPVPVTCQCISQRVVRFVLRIADALDVR
jgi:hypothetical protein